MALPVTFSFTGADNTALTTYNAGFTMFTGSASNFVIFSNRLQPNNGTNVDAYWAGDSFSNDHYAKATCSGTISGNYTLLYVRYSAGNYYYLQLGPNTSDGEYGESGVGSYATGITWTNGDIFELRAVGTTISLHKNGSQIQSTVDATYSTGSAGLGGYGFTGASNNGWDDAEFGNVAGAAATSSVLFPATRRGGFIGLIVQ